MLALCKILMASLDDVKRLAEECNVIVDTDDIEIGYRIKTPYKMFIVRHSLDCFCFKRLGRRTFNNLYTIKAGNRTEISQAELLHAMMSLGFRGVCRHNHFKGFEYADDEMIFDIIMDI